MVREDFEHLAQCCLSLIGCIEDEHGTHRPFTVDEFDRFVDRLIWAIGASPGGSPDFDHHQRQRFVDRCNGITAAEPLPQPGD